MSFTWTEDKIEWFARALEIGEYPTVFLPILNTMLDTESTVLEIGAGIGPFARMLAGKVRSVTALEPSGLALSHLKDTSFAKGILNIFCIESTWENWQGEEHDVVIASYVGESIVGSEQSLIRINSLARRGVVLIAPFGRSKTNFGIDSLYKILGREPPFRMRCSQDTQMILRELGVCFQSAKYTYEFGQPLQSVDEGVRFMSAYHEFALEELDAVRDFVREKVIETDSGYYFPSSRTSLVLYWYTNR